MFLAVHQQVIPGYAPIYDYYFNFLKQASHLLLDEHLMKDSLWGYNEQNHPLSGKQLYAERNSTDFCKLGKDYVASQVNALDLSLCGDRLLHCFCQVILVINSTTLMNCIG
jgi:hypothetical protein